VPVGRWRLVKEHGGQKSMVDTFSAATTVTIKYYKSHGTIDQPDPYPQKKQKVLIEDEEKEKNSKRLERNVLSIVRCFILLCLCL